MSSARWVWTSSWPTRGARSRWSGPRTRRAGGRGGWRSDCRTRKADGASGSRGWEARNPDRMVELAPEQVARMKAMSEKRQIPHRRAENGAYVEQRLQKAGLPVGMNVLAVDATGDALSVALGTLGRVLSARRAAKAHDEVLLPCVESLLQRARMRWKDLDAVAAAAG